MAAPTDAMSLVVLSAELLRQSVQPGSDTDPYPVSLVLDLARACSAPSSRPLSLARYVKSPRCSQEGKGESLDWDGAIGALEERKESIPKVVAGPQGPVASRDLINLTTARLTAALVARGQTPPGPLLTSAVRTLAGLMAEQHPGRTIEVRVPPAVAVQIGFGTGPRHTRGTPPNVIETDPLTFLRLATGQTVWEDALRDRQVAASGSAADLSPALPLL